MTLTRDPTRIDPTTNNPLCFGHQSPDALICMMCTFEQTCREQKKANKAKGGDAATLSFFEVEDDPFDDSDDDLEDEDFDE